MPQLNKGGKYVFGWSVIGAEGTIHFPTMALAWAFSFCQLRLYIYGEADFSFRPTPPGSALNSRQYILQVVAFPQRRSTQPGKAVLPSAGQTKAKAAAPDFLHFISGLLHQAEKFFQTGGTLRKRAVYGKAEPFLKVQGPLSFLLPLPIVFVFALAPGLRVLHNGEAVFQTQPVREPPEGKAGAPEVSELPGTVKGGGIVIDVTVDMLLVRVGRHKEGVAALRPAHSQFIADTVCLLRCDLTGIKGHAYLVTEHVRFLFLLPPC